MDGMDGWTDGEVRYIIYKYCKYDSICIYI